MENVLIGSNTSILGEEFVTELNRAASRLTNAYGMQKKLQKNLSETDLAISDILHDIELSRLSGAELMKDVVLLRQLLRERRKIKGYLSMAQTLQAVRDKLSSSMKKMEKADRIYHVRIMKGLKIAVQA